MKLTMVIKKSGLPVKDIAIGTGIDLNRMYRLAENFEARPDEFAKIKKYLESKNAFDWDSVYEEDPNITLQEIAHTINKKIPFVKAMVRNGCFGFYDKETNSYHVPRKAFENYMNGYNDYKSLSSIASTIRYFIREGGEDVGS